MHATSQPINATAVKATIANVNVDDEDEFVGVEEGGDVSMVTAKFAGANDAAVADVGIPVGVAVGAIVGWWMLLDKVAGVDA